MFNLCEHINLLSLYYSHRFKWKYYLQIQSSLWRHEDAGRRLSRVLCRAKCHRCHTPSMHFITAARSMCRLLAAEPNVIINKCFSQSDTFDHSTIVQFW